MITANLFNILAVLILQLIISDQRQVSDLCLGYINLMSLAN